jgi:hypothetical protein
VQVSKRDKLAIGLAVGGAVSILAAVGLLVAGLLLRGPAAAA